jgi:hypothetical protein
MHLFYVLHIHDRVLSDCVDAIRFLSNPREKQRAHITVRGPYKRRIPVENLNRKISGDVISINKVGNFFEAGQNTVFFECSSPNLKSVWKKRDFPFKPHLTLYDSGSRQFAERLFQILQKHQYHLTFKAELLNPLVSAKGQSSFSMSLFFNKTWISGLLNQHLNPEDISELSENHRLALIDKICGFMSKIESSDEPLSRNLLTGSS